MEKKRTGLAQYLSRLDVWALSLGCIIGWGAFVMPGTTFLPVAGPVGTAVAMGISAVIMIVVGLNYSYLMRSNPGIGGVYAYTKRAFGRGHAFLSAWFLALSYLALIPQNATALAVICRTLFSDVVEQGIHYQIAGYDLYLREAAIAVSALVIIGVLAIRCKPFLQRAQTGLAVALLLGVLGIVLIALPRVPLGQIFSGPAFGFVHPARAVLSIVIMAPWAFVGFEVISLETAHFQFPVKKSRWLIAAAILIGGFIYVAMSIVAVAVVPDGYASWQDYIGNLNDFRGYYALPTFYAARELMGEGGLALIGVTAMAAVLSSVIGFYRATSRILENMADDRILTGRFSEPRRCILFVMCISILIALLGRNALSWVVDLSSFGAIVGFGYTSVIAYRTARAAGHWRIVRTGQAGIAISLAFGLAQLMPRISAIETMAAESYFLLSLWCLLGFAFYWRTMRESRAEEQINETATITSLFVLLFYAALVWYIKKILRAAAGENVLTSAAWYSVVFGVVAVLGLIVMLMVLSQMRKRQERLESERISALESSRAKSRFLFNMSHDLRTPLNAILGFAHLGAWPGTSPEEKDEYLRKVESAGGQLLGIINDVLDMSLIESGNLELSMAPMCVTEAVRDVKALFDGQMEEKRIAFSLDIQGVSEDWVLCDRNRFSRVILNLLSNACKFTQEGGGWTCPCGRRPGRAIGGYTNCWCGTTASA